MSTLLKVCIIGGGLGGLCLAQGLKQAGIEVAVYERDHVSNDRLQGYRIHIESQGNHALAACLPPDLFRRYLATSGSGGSGYRMSTEQLHELYFFRTPQPTDTSDSSTLDRSVSRITLREMLLSGLDDVVHFNKTFTHYEEMPDNLIKAHFADGTSATGNVLVAADGVRSGVRQQLLPHAHPIETGVIAVMGKLALTDATRTLLVPGKLDGATSILGPHGRSMFLALHELGEQLVVNTKDDDDTNSVEAVTTSGLLLDNKRDYLFWAFLAREETYPQEVRHLEGHALQQIVAAMLRGWHPCLQQIVNAADPDTIIAKPLHTAAPLKPWKSKNITLVGDAIHCMPPTRGIGGNTALRDAHVLCQQLVAAHSGQKQILQAIHDYESEMRRYADAAVQSSLQALNLHVGERRLFTTTLLRGMNALLNLQQRLSLQGA